MNPEILELINEELRKRIPQMSVHELLNVRAEYLYKGNSGNYPTPFTEHGADAVTEHDSPNSVVGLFCEKNQVAGGSNIGSVPDETTESTQEEPPAEESQKELTSTEKKKLELSEKIKELGGTPPGRGALKKYEEAYQALLDAQSSSSQEQDEPQEKTETPTEETKEETPAEEQSSGDDEMTFNDAYDLCVEEYEKAKERGVPANIVFDIVHEFDKEGGGKADTLEDLKVSQVLEVVERLKAAEA